MLDGSDAIADWPLLNALTNAVSGATWVSIHHGGGVGIGNSIHSGQVIVADGRDAAAVRLARVLDNDPGMGLLRHVDAGYEDALTNARRHDLWLPMSSPSDSDSDSDSDDARSGSESNAGAPPKNGAGGTG